MVAEKSVLAAPNNVTLYKETIPKNKIKQPKRKHKSDLGSDFIAPDGGWGWVVCFAAGFSNFFVFPSLQQYGLIYRQRMLNLNFDAQQSTTIINVAMAISSLIGIVNGAMFRKFTFRQVGFFGGTLCFLGIFLSAFCTTFLQYLFCYSTLYGMGLGLSVAATSLAVNTYFKNRRRRASGFSWSISGLGSIIFPYVSIFLLSCYGAQGAILIYSAIAVNSIMCAATLQPVLWHSDTPEHTKNEEGTNSKIINNMNSVNKTVTNYECNYCQTQKRQRRGSLSSQCILNGDDSVIPSFEISEPSTLMMARANGGWLDSKLSPTSQHRYHKCPDGLAPTPKRNDSINEESDVIDNNGAHSICIFNQTTFSSEKINAVNQIYVTAGLDNSQCTCNEDKSLLQKEIVFTLNSANAVQMTFLQKVIQFFDLYLLKDFAFVNLIIGYTIMMFVEVNFSILIPFILYEFGYNSEEISLAMSILGVTDIVIRFLAPFALEKVKLDNRILFAFGIISVSVGRLVITFTSTYFGLIMVFILIGFGKGFRAVFSPLIIPSYVPLQRLPAASGIQLIFNSVFSFSVGPVLGIITDTYGYQITIHVFNSLIVTALILWLIESIMYKLKCKNLENNLTNNNRI